jgi:uncharacterized protein YkwD
LTHAIAIAVAAVAVVAASAVPALAARPATPAKPAKHSTRHHHHAHKPKAPAPASTTPAPAGATPAPARVPAPVVSCDDADLIPASGNLDRIAAATLCLVNQQRAVANRAPLDTVAAMTRAATAHSLDMVAANYLDQNGPSGSDPLTRLTQAGYVRPDAAVDIAENIAGQIGTASTPYATVSAWMASPGSRTIILTARYTDTGIGVVAAAPSVAGSGPGATYTEDFGATA